MSTTAPASAESTVAGQGQRSGLILIAMAAGVLLVSLAQTLAIPVLPQIRADLGISATMVGWVTTSTMLVASAITPLLGRLGDVYGNKPVIVVALVVTLAGSLLAAITHSLALLLVARVLHAASFGLFPLAISVLRDEMPRERLTGAMAIVASALGFGSGIALVATGLLTQGGADYRRIFWFLSLVTAIVLVMAVRVLPRRPGGGGRVDYRGATVLGLGLVALLLPISQGNDWGWGSPVVITLFVAAAVILTGWVVLQARTAEPLVSTSLLARRPVLATNLASFFVGFVLMVVFVATTYLVATTREVAGFGFSASVLRTSVEYMLPGAVASVLTGPVAGRLVGVFGPRAVLAGASAVGAIGSGMLALLHDTSALVIIGLIVVNVAIAGAYAAMPALLVRNVAPEETGVANSISSIMRTVGGAVGSALIVTVLASHMVDHVTPIGVVSVPGEDAYVVAFVLGAAAFACAAVLAAFAGPKGCAR